jgi:hypothetical protein
MSIRIDLLYVSIIMGLFVVMHADMMHFMPALNIPPVVIFRSPSTVDMCVIPGTHGRVSELCVCVCVYVCFIKHTQNHLASAAHTLLATVGNVETSLLSSITKALAWQIK